MDLESVLQTDDVRGTQTKQGTQSVRDNVHLVLGIDHLCGVCVHQQLVGRLSEGRHTWLVIL